MQKTELKFNSQVCTTKIQSQRLLELGLKPETADMCHHLSNPQDPKNPYTKLALDDYIYIHLGEEGWEDTIPAWSLHRLMELNSANFTEGDVAVLNYDNTYDDIIEDMEWAINKGYFNKEYLKQ